MVLFYTNNFEKPCYSLIKEVIMEDIKEFERLCTA